jgi:hypothetical protein
MRSSRQFRRAHTPRMAVRSLGRPNCCGWASSLVTCRAVVHNGTDERRAVRAAGSSSAARFDTLCTTEHRAVHTTRTVKYDIAFLSSDLPAPFIPPGQSSPKPLESHMCSLHRSVFMVSTLAAPPSSLNMPSILAPEFVGLAICPSCHTEDPSMTNLAVHAGADWRCSRCGSRWDAVRLATVAAYAAWAAERTATSVSPATHVGGDV